MFAFFHTNDLFVKRVAEAAGLNFISVLRTTFTLTDPESVKRY